MCGIAGFVGFPDPGLLRRMTDRIAHRGPDADGQYIDETSGVHFGHRRLSIIDISGGVQPMTTGDGQLTIVFNGEIYNFQELRTELQAAGHQFVTDHSDTEVLLHGYREWGPALTERLNGMWAFAIHDRGRNQLFLSRDRFGKKPLFYYANSDTFAFASELTALLEHPKTPHELDPISMRKYFAYGFVPAPRTHLAGVRKLPGGHSLLVDLETMQAAVTRYWQYQPEPNRRLLDANPDDLASELVELVGRAVQRRLVADVPVGTFLSGGIDSSFISALAVAHAGADKIKLFSIGFDEAAFDETSHAKQVAAHVGGDHSIETLSIQRALDILPVFREKLDEPFADSSLLPTYLLCQHARREVTVALGGDGADELFAGYDPFKALSLARTYTSIIPRPLHKAINLAVAALPVSHGYMSLDFKIKRTLRGLGHKPAMWLPAWMAPLSPSDMDELLAERVPMEDVYSEAIAAWESCESADDVDRATAYFVNLYLQEDILAKVDRASMLNSLEVRAPFLDIEVVDFARRLPASLKLRNGTTKWLLKKAAETVIPRDVVYRKKQGFAVPVGRWFKDGELTVYTPDQSREGVFWDRMQARHRNGKADERLALWSKYILDNSALHNLAKQSLTVG